MKLTGKNVFQNYDMIRPQILELVEKSKEERAQGRGILTVLSSDLMLYLMRYFPKVTPKRLENFCNFVLDIPIEIAFLAFVCRVDDEPRNSEIFKYLVELHKAAAKDRSYYDKFYLPLMDTTNVDKLDKIGRSKFI